MYALRSRDDLGSGYHRLSFSGDAPLQAEAGQFVMVRSSRWGQAPLLPRPMSLLGAGDEPSMLIKVVGEGTRRMAAAEIGEPFAILGPLGKPWRLPDEHEAPLLVAGGVGVAPLICLARVLCSGQQQGGSRPPLTSLYGARSDRDLPLASELEARGDLLVSTEDGSRGVRGLVTVLLEHALAERADQGIATRIYACGPHPMMAAVARLAARLRVPCEVSLEAPMGCGYGVCLGCALPRAAGGYLYTCVEGPCVNAAELDWDQEVVR